MEVTSSVQDDLAQIAANRIVLVQGSYKLLKSECSSSRYKYLLPVKAGVVCLFCKKNSLRLLFSFSIYFMMCLLFFPVGFSLFCALMILLNKRVTHP